MRNRNCVIWVALDVLEYFLCPLLAWNKNAQLEQGGAGGLGCPARNAAGAVSSSPSRALPVLLPPPTPPHPKQPVALSLRASLRREDPEGGHWTRVLQSSFLFCLKNRFLTEPSLPTPGE